MTILLTSVVLILPLIVAGDVAASQSTSTSARLGLNAQVVFLEIGSYNSSGDSTLSPGCSHHFPHANGTAYNVSRIRFAYNWNANSSSSGVGSYIVILAAFSAPNLANDLSCFDSVQGLPAPPYLAQVQPWGTPPTVGVGTWPDEITADVEWAHAIAPASAIVVVETKNQSANALLNLAPTYAYLNYPRYQTVITMSYGYAEHWLGCSALIGTYDPVFSAVSSYGDATVAASGNFGAFADYQNSSLDVDYPASDPNVLGVGGTHLDIGGYESVWNSWGSTHPGASGGGQSGCFAVPSYQSAESVNITNGSGTFVLKQRGVPDVAYDADYYTGYWIYDTEYGFPGWIQIGGTSLGAPQWAGVLADIQGHAPYLNFTTMLHEYTYDLSMDPYHSLGIPQTLNDIAKNHTAWDNRFWYATWFWDACTGVGTPIMSQYEWWLGTAVSL